MTCSPHWHNSEWREVGLTEDVDNDGIVGVADILDILAFYGEACAN